MDWSPQQDSALKAVQAWLKSPGDQQVFRLFGEAGTGKTTLAREIAGMVRRAITGAYTGKAAHVLTSKGLPAQTLHSLAYVPKSRSKERAVALKEALQAAKVEQGLAVTDDEHEAANAEVGRLKREMAAEEANHRRPMFALNLASDIRDADLLIIDEVSMVDASMGQDVESFGKPILVLGDPAQLPPIHGGGYFTECKPDIMLTEIHRQALDNPIIAMSRVVRDGKRLKPGQYGTSRVLNRADLDPADVLDVDQVLTGTHNMRLLSVERIRSLRGFEGVYPNEGERLVCLRNNSEFGLLNGSLWTTTAPAVVDDEYLGLNLLGEGGSTVQCLAHRPYFHYEWAQKKRRRVRSQETPAPWETNELNGFDYGYVLTVHKAQGSQFGRVMVFDDWRGSDWNRWMYTALTRAESRVTVVQW